MGKPTSSVSEEKKEGAMMPSTSSKSTTTTTPTPHWKLINEQMKKARNLKKLTNEDKQQRRQAKEKKAFLQHMTTKRVSATQLTTSPSGIAIKVEKKNLKPINESTTQKNVTKQPQKKKKKSTPPKKTTRPSSSLLTNPSHRRHQEPQKKKTTHNKPKSETIQHQQKTGPVPRKQKKNLQGKKVVSEPIVPQSVDSKKGSPSNAAQEQQKTMKKRDMNHFPSFSIPKQSRWVRPSPAKESPICEAKPATKPTENSLQQNGETKKKESKKSPPKTLDHSRKPNHQVNSKKTKPQCKDTSTPPASPSASFNHSLCLSPPPNVALSVSSFSPVLKTPEPSVHRHSPSDDELLSHFDHESSLLTPKEADRLTSPMSIPSPTSPTCALSASFSSPPPLRARMEGELASVVNELDRMDSLLCHEKYAHRQHALHLDELSRAYANLIDDHHDLRVQFDASQETLSQLRSSHASEISRLQKSFSNERSQLELLVTSLQSQVAQLRHQLPTSPSSP